MKIHCLHAGAGVSKIEFPDSYFPQDGYAGVYSDMHARALVIECGLRVLLISMELPSIRPFELMDGLRDMAGALADILRDQVWLCMTHSLSAPHVPKADDPVRFEMHMKAIRDAICAAVQEALTCMRPARMGMGRGRSAVIANRDIESVDGWWIGLTGKDPSDDTLSVLRFDDLSGKPIAVLYNHALKPCVLEETVMSDGKRYASSDLCGVGSRIVEEKLGAPALFFMGAGGEQFPRKKGHYLEVGADGHFHAVNHAERAYDMLAELGEELAADVLSTTEAIECDQIGPQVALRQVTFRAPGKQVYPKKTSPVPVKHYTYMPDLEQEVSYAILRIGPCAMVGVKPEIMTPTMAELKRRSPFQETMLFSMVNGGQSYIADDKSFARFEFPAMNTTLGQGTDRLFLEKTLKVLQEMV